MNRLTTLLSIALVGSAQAAPIGFQWEPIEDARPIVYEVHWGNASQDYNESASTTETSIQLDTIPVDVLKFYAVRACLEDRSRCSAFSNEVSYAIPGDPAIPAGFTINISISVDPQ